MNRIKNTKAVDKYITEFPIEVRKILQEIRGLIRESAPEAQETICYGIPTFKLKGNLVHFAAFKQHIGFYPTPSAIKEFKKELAEYKQAKGSVQFPLDRPVPLETIKKIVTFRVKESFGQ